MRRAIAFHVQRAFGKEKWEEFVTLLQEAGIEVTELESPEKMEGLPHLVLAFVSGEEDRLMDQIVYPKELPPVILFIPNGIKPEEATRLLKGMDDVIRVQVEAAEMAMRVRRVLSRIRNYGYVQGKRVVLNPDAQYDPETGDVIVQGEKRHLTKTEAALLEQLLKHRGKVMDADSLIEAVWRIDPSVKDRNALRVHIHRLRNKIETDPDDPIMVLTERGIGYSFAAMAD